MLQEDRLALHLIRLRQNQQAFDAALEDLSHWLISNGTSAQAAELLRELEQRAEQVGACVERLSTLTER